MHLGYDSNKKIVVAHDSFLTGQHTVLHNRKFYDDLRSIQIIFQPGALYRLLGIPVDELTNMTIPPRDVFGPNVEDICEQMYHARSYSEMLSIAERFITMRVARLKGRTHPIDQIVQQMVACNVPYSLDVFIDSSCLSHRQFDRKFLERTGIGPKEFMRVTRFYRAYLMRNKYPNKDWLTVALDSGYYDYQHLTRDYKEFTGMTPKQFFALDSPERTLGGEEIYDSREKVSS